MEGDGLNGMLVSLLVLGGCTGDGGGVCSEGSYCSEGSGSGSEGGVESACESSRSLWVRVGCCGMVERSVLLSLLSALCA